MDERGGVSFGTLNAPSQILNLKRAKKQHVLVHENPASVLMRAARKMGLHANFYGTALPTNEDLPELAGLVVQGFVGTHSHNSWYQEDCSGCAEMETAMMEHYKKIA